MTSISPHEATGSAFAVLLLLVVQTSVGAVDPARFKTITSNPMGPFEYTHAEAEALEIAKIEMVANNGGEPGCHWIARITPVQTGKHVVLGHLVDPFFGGEYYEKAGRKGYDIPGATVEHPKEVGTATALKLGRLMECVSGNDIKDASGKCFLFVYRVMLFAKGLCKCYKCLEPGYEALEKLKALVEDNKDKVGLSEGFKTYLLAGKY